MKLAVKVIRMDDRRNDGPQLEDGYIRIANELFDAILGFRFTLKQQNVVLAILRKTYGYGKKCDDMSASQIGALCGIARNHVTETLNQLCAMNVITKRDGEYGCIVGINKRHREWLETPANTRPESGQSRIRTSPKLGLEVVPNRDKSSPESGQVDSPESGHTKDNLPKDNQKTTSKEDAPAEAVDDAPRSFGLKAMLAALPNLSPEVAADYLKFRRKTPLTATAWKSIVKQIELSGWTPDDALAEAMNAGWRGVKAEWLANRNGGKPPGAPAAHGRRVPARDDFESKDYGKGRLI